MLESDMTDAAPAAPFLPRPIHHVGFHVADLRSAVDTWVTVYGAGPFYLLEHVAFDECTSRGEPAVRDHSAAFGQWGAVPWSCSRSTTLRPAELARPLTADGRSAVSHVGVTADHPAAESVRLESLGFGLTMYARLGEFEFFWHD